MKPAQLDKHVQREAAALLRKTARLLGRPGKLVDRASLVAARDALAAALAAHDLAGTRRLLPLVDGLLDAEHAAMPVSFARELFEAVGTALTVAILLRLFVVEAFKIPSSSMIPTLEIGDYLFVNKFVFGPRVPFTETRLFDLRAPARGEVVVFNYPCDGRNFIKRVVALPGDTVEMRCSRLYVNGEAIPQLRQDGVCEFYDTNEFEREDCMRVSSAWSKCPCSRYRERLGAFVFETNYDAARIDQPWRDGDAQPPGPSEPYISRSSDFPQLPHATPAVATPARFQCTEQRGRVEVVTKDRGVIGAFEPAAVPSPDPCGPRYHYTVPPGYVFAMGDNRDHSNDSRFWGPVPFSALKGKAIFVFWSRGEPSGLRLERFGQFIH